MKTDIANLGLAVLALAFVMLALSCFWGSRSLSAEAPKRRGYYGLWVMSLIFGGVLVSAGGWLLIKGNFIG